MRGLSGFFFACLGLGQLLLQAQLFAVTRLALGIGLLQHGLGQGLGGLGCVRLRGQGEQLVFAVDVGFDLLFELCAGFVCGHLGCVAQAAGNRVEHGGAEHDAGHDGLGLEDDGAFVGFGPEGCSSQRQQACHDGADDEQAQVFCNGLQQV